MGEVNQSNNEVTGGDIVGRDKITKNFIIEKPIKFGPYPKSIRTYLSFDPVNDKKNTTLKKKLKDGNVSDLMIQAAVYRKINTLSVLIEYIKSEVGKRVIEDIYQNLQSLVNSRYLSESKNHKFKKTNLKALYSDFAALVEKFSDKLPVDEAFMEGMLYIATSNCAIFWEESDDT
ncbi:hypothetical protein EHQ92_18070 [Leptospira biflexa]|uniref:hypothetical protein n=1 Tax=Leptospira biflexa TaxID=172 RepID=UPI001090D5BE|nr:hypothetical protein [Leptospira biflexa]TGM41705.1 hypothetical protein EHQ92_18070 [Leptospira biflexa]TGM43882.1 hypothetical protein EHQ88_18090 [Leptospira biflexa]